MHRELQIRRGIPIANGDSNSRELKTGLVLDLMSSTGLMLDPAGGWQPKIAGMEGIWSDTPLQAGRTLLAGDDDNVVETMRLSIAGERIYQHMTILHKFVQEARDFWTTEWQIEPVYLRWWAINAPAPQYALIYNMTVDYATPSSNSLVGPVDVTLNIEREPYWRAIPPGQNPKIWYFERNSIPYNESGSDETTNDLNLYQATNQFLYETIANRQEWDDSPVAILERNYVTVPGENIPGDAPALTMIFIEPSTANMNRVLIGRNTKEQRNFDDAQALLLDGPSSAFYASTDTTFADDTGGVFNPSSSTDQRIQISFATAASFQNRFVWNGIGATQPARYFNLYRGRYACFLRARQTGGAAGDITMRLSAGHGSANEVIQTPIVSPTIQTGTGNTTIWPVTYMGILDIPIAERATTIFSQQVSGRGLTDEVVNINFKAGRSTGSGVLYVCDLMLLPIDEPSMDLRIAFDVDDDPQALQLMIDNTGYVSHGRPGSASMGHSGIWPGPLEMRGQDITLLPGKDNRLYFYILELNNESAAQMGMEIRLNIVPRWRGPRDAL